MTQGSEFYALVDRTGKPVLEDWDERPTFWTLSTERVGLNTHNKRWRLVKVRVEVIDGDG